jgi:hypothetical protein
MKTVFVQFLFLAALASLAVLVVFISRFWMVPPSPEIPVTGSSSSSTDSNNPLNLSVDPYTYPDEANSIDLQSEQYRLWLMGTVSLEPYPSGTNSFNNPMSLPMDPFTYHDEGDSSNHLSEQFRVWGHESEFAGGGYNQIFDDNNPLRILNSYLPNMEYGPVEEHSILDESYRMRYQITESYP